MGVEQGGEVEGSLVGTCLGDVCLELGPLEGDHLGVGLLLTVESDEERVRLLLPSVGEKPSRGLGWKGDILRSQLHIGRKRTVVEELTDEPDGDANDSGSKALKHDRDPPRRVAVDVLGAEADSSSWNTSSEPPAVVNTL